MTTKRHLNRASGFTLMEIIVAMFVLLMGIMGIFAVFNMGVHARLQAQELVISQELANQWADWIRFRLNDTGGGGGVGALTRGSLTVGAKGDFYEDTGNFTFGPGDPRNLPTYHRNVYRGYLWEITAASEYRPLWVNAEGGMVDWDRRGDGGSVVPAGMNPTQPLTNVELKITRGARRYPFNYVFSGVGLRYD
jgi:hypothetical protein